jgi:RNA polymerase sigma-70 factor (ECF subfamily)
VFTLNPALVRIELPKSRDLLEQARAGDADAFCGLCREYETRVLRQAMRLCGNETIAEDLAQETFVQAWKSLRRYNGRCQFFTWLCAILLNLYRTTLRQKRPVPISFLNSGDQETFENSIENLPDQNFSPNETAELREQAAIVLACIEALPAKFQQVIYLRFYVDDSLEGIGAALGCSVGTVKSRLFRAFEKLRVMNALQSANVESRVESL